MGKRLLHFFTGARLICALVVLFAGLTSACAKDPIMPLADIEPGMEGEWRTVVSGTEIESFRMKVIGVARNFIGPKRDVIICEALDPDQVLNGPVSGMSGSPVYIEGKLIGAYAYGFPFSKEQAILGVQPIEHMLEVLDYPENSEQAQMPRAHPSLASAQSGQWRMVKGAMPSHESFPVLEQVVRPLPVTLVSSGISAQTLRAMQQLTQDQNLTLMQGAGGGSSDKELPLQPGNAVAGVLMSGDFGIAGTGTVTWREGQNLLAFGHPFFQWGAVDMPMAGAEIITVVRSLISSFKLSNPGKVVGTIYQDRQTAIAGEVGREAKTASLSIAVETPVQGTKTYSAQVIQDYYFTPLLLTMGLMESTLGTMVLEREQSVLLEATLEVEDYGELKWNTFSGLGSTEAVFGFYFDFSRVMNNPFEVPTLKRADFKVTVREGRAVSKLRSARLLKSGEFKPGDTVSARVTLEHRRGELTEHTVALVLPEDIAPGQYDFSLMDAYTLKVLRRGYSDDDAQYTSLKDYLDYMNAPPRNDQLYVVLKRDSAGLRLEGQSLPNLPESARSLLLDASSEEPYAQTHSQLLKVVSVPLDSEYSGDHSFTINITR